MAFQTQKLGVTTYKELAASMQPLFPLGKSLNVSYQELFGSMATLTGVTGNTRGSYNTDERVVHRFVKTNRIHEQTDAEIRL